MNNKIDCTKIIAIITILFVQLRLLPFIYFNNAECQPLCGINLKIFSCFVYLIPLSGSPSGEAGLLIFIVAYWKNYKKENVMKDTIGRK